VSSAPEANHSQCCTKLAMVREVFPTAATASATRHLMLGAEHTSTTCCWVLAPLQYSILSGHSMPGLLTNPAFSADALTLISTAKLSGWLWLTACRSAGLGRTAVDLRRIEMCSTLSRLSLSWGGAHCVRSWRSVLQVNTFSSPSTTPPMAPGANLGGHDLSNVLFYVPFSRV
jgi:hypothetical protein